MSKTLLTIVVIALTLFSISSVHGSQSKLFELASQHDAKTPLEEPVDALEDVPEEEEVDVSSFFRALFDDSEEDDDDEENSNRESRNLEVGDGNSQVDSSVKSEEERAVTDEATVTKTNSFVDALLRKVNAELRKGGDPMKVKLHKASKKSKSSKRNSGKAKKGAKKGKKNKKGTGAKKTKASKRNTGGKKKGGNKKGKKQGRKSKPDNESQRGKNKSERRSRKLRLLETEEESNVEETEATEPEGTEMNSAVLSRARREIEIELVDAAENEPDSEDSSLLDNTEQKVNFRQSKDMDFSGRGLGMASRRAQNLKLSKDKKKGKGNKKSKKGSKKPKKASKKNPTSHAVITGISTLERRGNVQISQNAKSQRIVADFSLGPVSVEVSRKFGGGDKRTARSFSPSLAGKIIIEINKNGNARVSKMTISPPKNVRTTGSLAKSDSKKKMKAKQERYMKTSIKRVTPKLSKKIRFAAQRVLSATTSAVRSN